MRGFYERLKASPIRPGLQGAFQIVVGALLGVNTGFISKGLAFLDPWMTVLCPVSCGVYLYDRGRSA